MDLLKNQQKDKFVIDIVEANKFAMIIVLPIILVFGIPYYLVWKQELGAILQNFINDTSISVPIFIFLFTFLGIIAHELIHGVVWAIFAEKGFKSISFGVIWKLLTPYCHCDEPLKVKHYILGAVMPGLILGILPAVIAIIIGNFGLLIFGIFFTQAASGDFMIINLLKKENMDDYVEDHPSEAGCYIYRE